MATRTVVGFYREDGKTKPITKSFNDLNRKKLIVNPSKLRLPKPSWQRRPIYVMKGAEVHLGIYDRHKGVVDSVPIEALESSQLTRGYESAGAHAKKPNPIFHYSGSPDLTPAKKWQRRALLQKMSPGTVLELYAGKGNLSAEVWKHKAKKIILVDKNAEYLREAAAKLKGKSHVIVRANNLKWLEQELPQEKLSNLTVVDFDAFGSPAPQIRRFFNGLPVKKSMIVAVTDGSCIYAKIGDGNEKRKFFLDNYGSFPDGTRDAQLKALDGLMQKQARTHGFKVQPINAGFGRQTVYAGYKITPD